MAIYSINDLEKLSGLKAHTLRIWEKRYNIIPNNRSKNNVRYYKEEDLKQVLNIALLNKNGHKISSIAKMTHDEIAQKVAGYCNVGCAFEDQIDGLTLSMFELNEYKFSKIIDHHTESKGFEMTMEQIIYPFLEKLKCMCTADSISMFHMRFIENIIKRKVVCEIDAIKINTCCSAKRFMIFLPDGPKNELEILFLYYILRLQQANVLYLGINVSIKDVMDAYMVNKTDYLLTIVSRKLEVDNLQEYVVNLSDNLKHCQIGVLGHPDLEENVVLPENVSYFNSLSMVKNKFCKGCF